RLYTLEGAPTNAGAFIRPRGFTIGNTSYFRNARYLVRAAEELQKPNEDRLREYVDSALPALKQKLFSTAPVHDDYEMEALRFALTKLREVLGPDDALVRKVFGTRSPDDLARELVTGSKLKDLAVRKQLFEGGKAAIDASNDPMIQLARLVDPAAREVRAAYEHGVDSVEKRNQGKIAKARFKLEVVGLIFDGNIQSLGGEYWFDPSVNRSVSVSSPALMEALDHIYGASRIVGEIRGGGSSTGSN